MSSFPKNFYFGAATSAHQVEGGNHNDWSVWEEENADQLSRKSGGKYPSENYISGRACDHYNRYEEDFDIAQKLGHNAHRFSIEWSRIEPEEGKFNEKEIEHYRAVIRALCERGMEPFVTLWHWTLPVWFRDQGGWVFAQSVEQFRRYAERMAKEFPEVRFWITLNEANVYTDHGYWKGIWPPGIRSIVKYFLANHHLSRAHCGAYEVIKQVNPHAQIGVAHNVIYFQVRRRGVLRINCYLKELADWWWNHRFLNAICDQQDFIGLNQYFHSRIDYGFNKNENKVISDLGWEVYPVALYYVLLDLQRYKKPIYITENGVADAGDEKRVRFIQESVRHVQRARAQGADVRGYFYWSLLDNFEWDKGFWPRFGLVEVDYKTLARRIRPSALIYKKIIESVRVPSETSA